MVDIDDAMMDENFSVAASGPRTRGARNAAIAAAAAIENDYSDSSVSVPIRGSRSASAGVATAMAAERGLEASGRNQMSTRRRGHTSAASAAMNASTTGRMAASHANMVMSQSAVTGASNAAEDDQEVYCICRDKAHGEMIGCDNKGCKIEWFHMSCVGFDAKSPNVASWFCPDCAQSMATRDSVMEGAKKPGHGRNAGGTGMGSMEIEVGKVIPSAFAGTKRQTVSSDGNIHVVGFQGSVKKQAPMGKPPMNAGPQVRGPYGPVDTHGYAQNTVPGGHVMPGGHVIPAGHVQPLPTQQQQQQHAQQQQHLPQHAQHAQHAQQQQQPMQMHGVHGAQPMPGYTGHNNLGYIVSRMPIHGGPFLPQGDMSGTGHPNMPVSMPMMQGDGQMGQNMLPMNMAHPMQGGPGQPMPDMYTGNPGNQQTGHSTQGYNATT